MSSHGFDWKAIVGTVLLAALLWFVTFYLDWGVFWFKISISALLLAVLSLALQSKGALRFSLTPRTIGIGLFSAILLYLIFWAGKSVSTAVLPFAGDQIGAIPGREVRRDPEDGAAVVAGAVFRPTVELLEDVEGEGVDVGWRYLVHG